MMTDMNKSERMAGNSHLLRTFIAVAECQSVTRAAEQLGRTQSAISVQARALEDTLQVALFARQSTGMLLTAEGEKLLPVARLIVSELARIGTMFEEPLRGPIRVGIPDDYADSVLEAVLVQFAQRHPEVEVSARFGCTTRFPDAIKNNTLDVAVVSESNPNSTIRMASENNVWLAANFRLRCTKCRGKRLANRLRQRKFHGCKSSYSFRPGSQYTAEIPERAGDGRIGN